MKCQVVGEPFRVPGDGSIDAAMAGVRLGLGLGGSTSTTMGPRSVAPGQVAAGEATHSQATESVQQ